MKILLLVLFSLCLGAKSISFNHATQNPTRVYPNSSESILSYSKYISQTKNSIVNISTKSKVKQTNNKANPFADPFFEQFFGKDYKKLIPKNRVKRSLGSGVILSSDGYIVTNAHVVQDAQEIEVSIADKEKKYQAKIVGIDIDSDLAVVKIDKSGLQAIKIGSSKHLEVGDVVFAIGNPFGVGQTVTKGIISALNKNHIGINKYENFIQTDASINPGNSGGALIDSRGVLIGINSAIVSRAGGNNGIGFAIPVTMVKDITAKLIKYGKVTRGYLGVSIKNITKELQSLYKRENGAIIINIAKNSSAEKYGLKRGDLVYRVGDKQIKDASNFSTVVGSYKPDDTIVLHIERDKNNKQISVVLGKKEADIIIAKQDKLFDGVTFKYNSNLNQVEITKVQPNTKGYDIGLRVGDIVVQVEKIEIFTIKDLKRVLNRYKGKKKRIYIKRNNQIYMVVSK
ncbi:MAG: serine protease [Epsilonproteobacteria bacterium]|nr:MAG: serine protease [Campylobacterota bacterium]